MDNFSFSSSAIELENRCPLKHKDLNDHNYFHGFWRYWFCFLKNVFPFPAGRSLINLLQKKVKTNFPHFHCSPSLSCSCPLDENSMSVEGMEGKSAYITMSGRGVCEGNTLHAPLILHLTVAAWRRARPAEHKVGRHHGSNDSLTFWEAASFLWSLF